MFVHMKKIPAKTADALDLIIEFSTLGEYGLEYPDQHGGHNREGIACAGGRRRPGAPDTRGVPNRPLAVHATTRGAKADTCDQASGHSRQKSSNTQAGNPEFASALRPPRIQLSFSE